MQRACANDVDQLLGVADGNKRVTCCQGKVGETASAGLIVHETFFTHIRTQAMAQTCHLMHSGAFCGAEAESAAAAAAFAAILQSAMLQPSQESAACQAPNPGSVQSPYLPRTVTHSWCLLSTTRTKQCHVAPDNPPLSKCRSRTLAVCLQHGMQAQANHTHALHCTSPPQLSAVRSPTTQLCSRHQPHQ